MAMEKEVIPTVLKNHDTVGHKLSHTHTRIHTKTHTQTMKHPESFSG